MSGWVEWAGGNAYDAPVADGTKIDVRFSGDPPDRSWPSWRPENLMWDHHGWANDIVAYSVVGLEPVSPVLAPRALFDAVSPLQEDLAINISDQIANGVRPDAVQVPEWAAALYEAEVGGA